MNLTEMIGAPVFDPESNTETGTIVDVLIDTDIGTIPYVLIDNVHGPAREGALVSRTGLTRRDGSWCAKDLTQVLATHRDRGDVPPAGSLDLTSMPSALVGPFGYTVSPVVAGALINSITGRKRIARPEIDQNHANWFWFETLQGLPLFDSSGPLGDLADIVIDPDHLRCVSLVVKAEDGTQATHVFDKMRHVSRDEDSIILELSSTPPYSVDAVVKNA